MFAEKSSNQLMHESSLKENGTLTYGVPEIAEILNISKRTAYEFCKKTADFKVVHIGRCVRVHKVSFDNWFAGCRS